MIGKIIPCPVAVSETKYIKIVGDATRAPASPHAMKNTQWDYKAVCYDPIKQVQVGGSNGVNTGERSWFSVSKEEVELWTAKQN